VTDVTLFIDSKAINDYFFTASFKGEPVICKFSSVAISSIRNEYELTSLLYSELPSHFPKPYMYYEFKSVRGAVSIVERIPGERLRKIVAEGGMTEESEVVRLIDDLRKILSVLNRLRIVHRDFHIGNLIQGSDGHFCLIDMQFAVRKNEKGCYQEDPFMLKWFWSFVPVFGCRTGLGVGKWNDIYAIRMFLSSLPKYETVLAFDAELAQIEEKSTLYVKPNAFMRFLFPFNRIVCYLRLIYHKFYKSQKILKFKQRLALIESASIGWKRN
jgi:serine/threonine protein kinase